MTDLIPYGIMEEKSDIRAHVSPQTKAIYVFKTLAVKTLIQSGSNKFKELPAYQPNVNGPTALGLCIPISAIPDLRIVHWGGSFSHKEEWWKKFNKDMSTSEKGKKAVKLVHAMLKDGAIPLWVNPETVKDLKVDIEGTDIIIVGGIKIQVKCDWKAGPITEGGTGNIYAQTYERNPLKKY